MINFLADFFVEVYPASFVNVRVAKSEYHASEVGMFRSSQAFRCAVGLCFTASLALIVAALWWWGATEVRGHVGEVLFLTFVGCLWLVLSKELFTWLGLSMRDDAVERRNPAALVALSGAMVSVALTFAGGNLGEGPSYLNNVFSAALGTGGLFSLWLLLELGARVSVSVAEERDFASGLRFCGFQLAIGLILGRAVAGDWHSESATINDFFRDGWIAAVFCALAIVVERLLRPSRQRPFPPWRSYGLLPALLYLGSAAAWLWHLGKWEGMPK